MSLQPNPWAFIPSKPPFVLPSDASILSGFRDTSNLALHLLPVPFHGDPRQATILLLGLNPSYVPQSDRDENSEFVLEHRLALTFASRTPFFNLDPAFAGTTAYRYWYLRLRALIEVCGIDRVRQSVATIQWFPYRSPTFTRFPRLLPSQSYGFDLVRHALDRRTAVVILRSRKLWLEAVPELENAGYFELKVPRSTYVSPGNLPQGAFEKLASRLAQNSY